MIVFRYHLPNHDCLLGCNNTEDGRVTSVSYFTRSFKDSKPVWTRTRDATPEEKQEMLNHITQMCNLR